jgi:N-acetylated-alpha-linked acidic dipeptidase
MYRQRPRRASRALACVAGMTIAGCLAAATPAGTATAPRAPAVTPRITGFDAAGSAEELALERRFDAQLSAADLRGWMQQLASAPNNVGSEHDRQNAEFVRDQLRRWGWQADIEEFSVLYPTPKHESLELVSPGHYQALLREPPLTDDAAALHWQQQLPPYNVYGADGDVTGELVYVNYGMPADYLELDRRGISVKGKIAIARYGAGWRGLKPKLAYEHGAIGCLIYSDPRDDGYGMGDAYPKGGLRPPDAVQRGSVQDLVLYTGDPLTPGKGSTPATPRLALADAKTVLKIPVLPISYADAQPLLAAIGGPVAPASWRGGLPLTYHLGPGPATVRLQIQSDWGQKTLYDVIARLRGHESPDQWILRGNHRDAWVFGASDPLSGHVAWLAEAKALGALAKSGWKPRRTLVYASWDGEEPGLLGSTEWLETHAAELSAKAALYINTDMTMRGVLEAEGSQGLRRFVSEAAASVADPATGVNLVKRAAAVAQVEAYEAGGAKPAVDEDLPLGALGSGSDYTPFLQHLGIASLNLEFSGEGQYGVYHSAYDSFDHFSRFVDPSFEYGVATAKVAGRLVLRAAQAPLLPMRAQDFAHAVSGYLQELHRLYESQRASADWQRALMQDDAFKIAADPDEKRAAPEAMPVPAPLEFAVLDAAVERLNRRAEGFDAQYDRLLNAGDSQSRASRARCNALLTRLEAQLTDSRGLPGRPWFTHMIYAPGFHTGYGVKTLPGVREAIEEHRWDEATRYMAVIAGVLDAYGQTLESAVGPLAAGRH